MPEVLQFYGMELNMPGMDHHALVVPRTDTGGGDAYARSSTASTRRTPTRSTRRGTRPTRAWRRSPTWRRFPTCRC
ncbi:MAG: hypothetical protein R2712_11360 [Vicinamibacterales bacterium]